MFGNLRQRFPAGPGDPIGVCQAFAFVSFSDFRQIANGAESGRADRLFRAAVSAFCALTRPSRREIAQLEDLTLPLFDAVSVEARRYVAAILSEIDHAPPELVRRLSNEPVAIAAPLLMRSKLLSDIDLIRLIANHGLPHARAIARRAELNPTIADLVKALERPAIVDTRADDQASSYRPAGEAGKTDIESVRQRLRGMMLSPPRSAGLGQPVPCDRAAMFEKLSATALTGRAAYFQTALADLLGIGFGKARSIAEATGYDSLITAFRALDLGAEQAFLLTAAIRPGIFAETNDIKRFLDRYRLCRSEAAREELQSWRSQAPVSTRQDRAAGSHALKAS